MYLDDLKKIASVCTKGSSITDDLAQEIALELLDAGLSFDDENVLNSIKLISTHPKYFGRMAISTIDIGTVLIKNEPFYLNETDKTVAKAIRKVIQKVGGERPFNDRGRLNDSREMLCPPEAIDEMCSGQSYTMDIENNIFKEEETLIVSVDKEVLRVFRKMCRKEKAKVNLVVEGLLKIATKKFVEED